MATVLTDLQIKALLEEPKPITPDFRSWLTRFRTVGEQRVCTQTIKCKSGHRFGVVIRSGIVCPNDFSVGLRLIRPHKDDIALVRCNGWHAEHRNKLDRGTPIYRIPENTFHIHIAQERYLALGRPKKIGFAFPTDAFSNVTSALEYLVDKFGFISTKTRKPFKLYELFPW